MSLKSIFAAIGVVALLDYMSDREFDLTSHVINESSDAVTSVVNWGERQYNRLAK